MVLHAAGDLDLDGTLEPAMATEFRNYMATEFRNYLVVQTPVTLRRFQETVVPGVELADQAALARIFERWRLRTVPEQGPAYANPRATFAVLDRAGHGLLHEQVGLGTALLAEWLDRVREDRATTTAGNE